MGYRALDAEISIYESRDLDRLELYDDGLHEILASIRQLESNTSVSILLSALKSLPEKKDFKAVRTDLNFAKVSSDNFIFSYKFPLFMFICSIIIFTVFIAFYRAYLNYSLNTENQ
jgi:hypothetical protein